MSDVFAYLDPEPSPGSMAHPEAVWAQAKEDYLGGDSAGVVCQRYSLSRSRFFERAKAQGWRRRYRERGSIHIPEPLLAEQSENI